MSPAFSSNLKFVLSQNLKVGVLGGGNSSERKISLRSGRAVFAALLRLGFQAVFIDPRDKKKMNQSLKKIDIGFIALHGKGGEDGQIQRLLERKKIPYIGSGSKASLKAFDKQASKRIFVHDKIPTAAYTVVSLSNFIKKINNFGMPCFVKPLTEGSSIGAFAVEDLQKSAVKLRRTLKRYGRLLVERKIEGRELTVGVLKTQALPVIEMKPKSAFYDFHAKYTRGMTDYIVPAKISPSLAHRLQRIALKTHRSLGLRDFSRVDIMLDEKNRPYVLEANSIPGFTELSLLPKAAQAAGISFDELCLRLVQSAYKRGKK